MPPKTVKYTQLAVTINTNKAATTAFQERYLKEQLARFVRVDLGSVATWRKLINIEPSFDAVDHISIDAIGIERGDKLHRIHVHFVVTIQHHGRVSWKGMQRPLQNVVNERLPGVVSYANINLLDTRRLNYAMKMAGTLRQIAVIDTPIRGTF